MEGFDPALFSVLVNYEQTSFWFTNRARLIISLLQRHFSTARAVLEIGCGTGSVLLELQRSNLNLSLTGSELHPEGLRYARDRLGPAVALLQMDARNIPARSHFDVIGAFDVIEHIAEDDEVLAQMRLALKPNGGAIISVPQHAWLWSPADEAAFHQRRYAVGELENKLRAAGFRVLQSASFNAVLIPLMIASRQLMLLRQRRGEKVDPLAEFKMPALLNRVLSLALRGEVALTLRGVNWPVGGSRVVVAQRM